MKNIIESKFTPADITAFDGLLEQIEALLDGKNTALTEEERSRYGSINEQNKLLVNKTLDLRQNDPDLSSPDVNWDEFEKDFETRAFLETRSDRLLRTGCRARKFCTITTIIRTRSTITPTRSINAAEATKALPKKSPN